MSLAEVIGNEVGWQLRAKQKRLRVAQALLFSDGSCPKRHDTLVSLAQTNENKGDSELSASGGKCSVASCYAVRGRFKQGCLALTSTLPQRVQVPLQ